MSVRSTESRSFKKFACSCQIALWIVFSAANCPSLNTSITLARLKTTCLQMKKRFNASRTLVLQSCNQNEFDVLVCRGSNCDVTRVNGYDVSNLTILCLLKNERQFGFAVFLKGELFTFGFFFFAKTTALWAALINTLTAPGSEWAKCTTGGINFARHSSRKNIDFLGEAPFD